MQGRREPIDPFLVHLGSFFIKDVKYLAGRPLLTEEILCLEREDETKI
jgi:hypothetical protein